jgi:hypothetical protein
VVGFGSLLTIAATGRKPAVELFRLGRRLLRD